jgi:hypothetical protein
MVGFLRNENHLDLETSPSSVRKGTPICLHALYVLNWQISKNVCIEIYLRKCNPLRSTRGSMIGAWDDDTMTLPKHGFVP